MDEKFLSQSLPIQRRVSNTFSQLMHITGRRFTITDTNWIRYEKEFDPNSFIHYFRF